MTTSNYTFSAAEYTEHVNALVSSKGSIEKAIASAQSLVKMYDSIGKLTKTYLMDKLFIETKKTTME